MDNSNIKLVSKLGTIASTLSSITDLQTLAISVNKIVDSIVDVKYNGLYLLDQETRKLKLYYAKGFSNAEKQKAELSAMDRHPGWVLKTKEILLIADTQKEKTGQSKDSHRSFVIRSRVWLPVMSLDSAVGSFGLASTQVNQFSEEHIALLSFVCNLAGVVYNNISLKNKQEKNNKNLIKALDEANRAKQTKQNFLAKMSHEIRTPMNAILGMTNLLANTSQTPTQKNYTKTLTIASKNLLGLLDDILDFSRLESENYTLENIYLRPKDLFKKAYHSLKFKAREKNLELKYNVDEKVPKFILGDPLRLGQVLINLVSNAIKFTSKGTIWIDCTLICKVNDRYRLQFKVQDTGVGIKKEKHNQIFKSFQQEDDSTTRQFGGTGLGLSIAKEIVDLYGGRIWVESKKGEGASFFFEIDFDYPKTIELPNDIIEKKPISSLNKAKILLVEDNEINRYLALTILKKYQAIVDVAINGKVSIEKIRNNQYDLVLMDLQMPIMGGLTASKIIRKQLKSQVPIIALTANATRGVSNECFDAGMNDYITKPYEENDLINKIAKLIPSFINNKKLDSNIVNEAIKTTKPRKEAKKKQALSKKLYDLSNLKAIANDNPKELAALIQVFITETPKMLNELHSCFKNESREQLFSVAHQLKSSIGVLSIPDLKKQLNQIESVMNSTKIPSTLGATIIKVTKKIELVLVFLEQDLANFSWICPLFERFKTKKYNCL